MIHCWGTSWEDVVQVPRSVSWSGCTKQGNLLSYSWLSVNLLNVHEWASARYRIFRICHCWIPEVSPPEADPKKSVFKNSAEKHSFLSNNATCTVRTCSKYNLVYECLARWWLVYFITVGRTRIRSLPQWSYTDPFSPQGWDPDPA
jgi:hypothetical protein